MNDCAKNISAATRVSEGSHWREGEGAPVVHVVQPHPLLLRELVQLRQHVFPSKTHKQKTMVSVRCLAHNNRVGKIQLTTRGHGLHHGSRVGWGRPRPGPACLLSWRAERRQQQTGAPLQVLTQRKRGRCVIGPHAKGSTSDRQ